MNINKTSYKVMFFSFVFILSSGVALYYSNLDDIPSELICAGAVEKNTSQYRFNALFSYNLNNNGDGVVVYNGFVTHDGKEKKKVGARVYFSYKHVSENMLSLTSKKNYILPGSEDKLILKDILSEFYINENKSYNLIIYNISQDGYMITDAQLPFLFCQTKK